MIGQVDDGFVEVSGSAEEFHVVGSGVVSTTPQIRGQFLRPGCTHRDSVEGVLTAWVKGRQYQSMKTFESVDESQRIRASDGIPAIELRQLHAAQSTLDVAQHTDRLIRVEGSTRLCGEGVELIRGQCVEGHGGGMHEALVAQRCREKPALKSRSECRLHPRLTHGRLWTQPGTDRSRDIVSLRGDETTAECLQVFPAHQREDTDVSDDAGTVSAPASPCGLACVLHNGDTEGATYRLNAHHIGQLSEGMNHDHGVGAILVDLRGHGLSSEVPITYGAEEVGPSHPLQEVLALEGVERLELQPLSREACDRLARQCAGTTLSQTQLERLAEDAAGNPYLVVELARAAAQLSADALPTVDELVGERLRALEEVPQRVVEVAAVAGGRSVK